MREYKFRGWDTESNQWVYGYYTKLVEGIRRFDAIIADIDGVLTRFYIHDPKTIGEYTGNKDKNGKEIYEDDILHTNEADWMAKVIWHYDGFMLTGLDNTGFSCSPDYDKCEIIGNLHQ